MLTMVRLMTEAIKAGIEVRRKVVGDIKEVFEEFPEAVGYLNCTGIGSYSLGGVEDKELYPTMVSLAIHSTTDYF
jgi:D-amino-acid oxidase